MEPTSQVWFPDGSILQGPTIEEIDQRSEKLIEEFREHMREVHASLWARKSEALEADGGIDQRKVFEGWAMQKLSCLQLYVEFYERVLIRMAAELAARRK